MLVFIEFLPSALLSNGISSIWQFREHLKPHLAVINHLKKSTMCQTVASIITDYK